MKKTGFMDLPTEIRHMIFSEAAGFCNLRRESATLINSLPDEPTTRHRMVCRLKKVENDEESDPNKWEVSRADARKYAAFHHLSYINRTTRAKMVYVEKMWLTKDVPIDIFELPSWTPADGQTVVTIAIKPSDSAFRHFRNANSQANFRFPEGTEENRGPLHMTYNDHHILDLLKLYVPCTISCLQLTCLHWDGLKCPCSSVQLCTAKRHFGPDSTRVQGLEWIRFRFGYSRKHCELVMFENQETLDDRYCMESAPIIEKAKERFLLRS